MNAIAQRALKGEKLTDVLIIDFHVHLASRWTGMHMVVSDPYEMVRRALAVGVSKLVVFGAIQPDMRHTNDMVAELARRYPDHVIGFATVNPYQVDMAEEVRRCFDELGLRGVKLHSLHDSEHSPAPIASYREEWDGLFAFLAQRKAPVLYHGIVSEDMIRSWPQVPFVQAHGVSDVEGMRRLARYPNYHVDTASTQNPAWAVSRAVQILGPERVLWGTDAPLDDFAQRLGVVLDSGLPEPEIRQILGLNAARLLQLQP